MSSKKCKKCGVEKGLSEFYAALRNSDGRTGKCKSCIKAYVRDNRRRRSEQYVQYEKSRANLPHRVEARQKYQEEHKEQISEYKKEWSQANGERVAAYKRDHYERNRKQVILRSKKWAEDNVQKVKMVKSNNSRKRRAAKYASLEHFTALEFQELCKRYGSRCLGCGDTESVLEADHIVPLTRGGADDIGNIQPLCGTVKSRSFCNFLQEVSPPLLPLHEHRPLRLAILQAPVLAQIFHVQVASARHPLLRLLNRQSRHQAQTRVAVREDPHHPRTPL